MSSSRAGSSSQRGRRRTAVNKRRKGVAPKGRALVSETHKSASLTALSSVTMPLYPPKVYKWLRYATTTTTVTATSGVPSAYVFRANSAFDPDYTSTGHQPMGFDNLMTSFNHYVVVKATIRVVARNLSAGVAQVALRQDADVVVITDKDRILEFGAAVAETLEGKGIYGANKEMSLSINIARLQGVSNSALTADTTLRGTATSDPTEVSYFHLAVWDSQGNTTTVAFDVVLDQLVCFLEPRTLATSDDLRTAVSYLKGKEGARSLNTSRFREALDSFEAFRSAFGDLKTVGDGPSMGYSIVNGPPFMTDDPALRVHCKPL